MSLDAEGKFKTFHSFLRHSSNHTSSYLGIGHNLANSQGVLLYYIHMKVNLVCLPKCTFSCTFSKVA